MLTPKKRQFAMEYLIDLNATQAAIRAGYSKKTAKSQGQRLLTDVDVQALIQELMTKRSERTQTASDKVLNEISALAYTNFTDIADFDGERLTFKSFDDLTDTQKKAIQSVKVKSRRIPGDTEGGELVEMEVKLADKKPSLELLGRHLKLFTDKVEHSGTVETKMYIIDRSGK